MVTLAEVNKLFRSWDDGHYDPKPHIFRRFSKGLYNLVSFAEETLVAYESHKINEEAKIANENKRLKKEHPDLRLGTILPGIIDDYFKPRLFDLCYLGAWASTEAYLLDVAWLVLIRAPSSSKVLSRAKSYKNICCDRETLATELIRSLHNQSDVRRFYKRVLNTDLNKNKFFKSIFSHRKHRNKLAHSGQALGYYSYIEQYEDSLITIEKYGSEKKTITEGFLCETLINMWKFGDFLRKKFFETKSPKSIERALAKSKQY